MTERKPVLVIGKDGLQGQVVRVIEATATGPQQVLVRFDNNQQVVLPVDALSLQRDGSYTLAMGWSELSQQGTVEGDTLVLPVIAEQLQVEKRQLVTGGVRVSKVVREQQETIDVPLLQEDVQVERVPINRVVESAPAVRHEGDTMIIPVLEEVLVVEKRLMLKEELRIVRRRTETNQPQHVTLRREEVVVEEINPDNAALADRGNNLA